MALGGLHQIRDNRPVSDALEAAAKLDKLFHFVNLDVDGELVLAGAGEAAHILVAEEDVQGGTIVLVGKEKVMAGTGGFSAGDLLTPEAGGAAVAAVAGDQACAMALEDAAAGEYGIVVVAPVATTV